MPFSLRIRRSFSAAHTLRLYDGAFEPVHGHNWRIELTVAAAAGLDAIGVVMDFHDLEKRLDAVMGSFHNRHLNELPAFAALNPSAENVAVVIARLIQLPDVVKLVSVEVWETPECSAVYYP